MAIEIKAFGLLADITGSDFSVIELRDTDSLRQLLAERYPALSTIHYAIAIDKKIVSGNTLINETSSVALLPPFSGG